MARWSSTLVLFGAALFATLSLELSAEAQRGIPINIESVPPGATVFIDNLAIPADARHPELAHQFIDFTLEADIAAEICETMKYSSPNRAAWPKLPEHIRRNTAIFPPGHVLERLELKYGGYRAAEWDNAADVEYTFYGLGLTSLIANRE